MPLIIETYENPYYKISDKLFPGQEFTFIDKPISEGTSEQFCYTRKELDSDRIMYYFNRICYIENDKIVSIDKTAQKIKFYDKDTGKLIKFEENIEEVTPVDNKSYLPQLNAQNGELVIFPDEEDEDD